MKALVHSLLLCFMIATIGVNGRFVEITEESARDGNVISFAFHADEPGPRDGKAALVKSACHGAINCHVMLAADASAPISFPQDVAAYVPAPHRALGVLLSQHLRPPILLG